MTMIADIHRRHDRFQKFLLFLIVCIVVTVIALFVFPFSRSNQLQFLKENYTFLKEPEINLNSIFTEKNRRIVFLGENDNPAYEYAQANKAAVIYMAEVEARVGKQDWLNRAYQSYALTPDEWERLKVLDRVSKDQKRLENVQNDRELISGDYLMENKGYVHSDDVLKERNIWVGMN